MEEGQEGPPKGKSFLQKGWKFLKGSLEAGIKKVPKEEINEETIADTIIQKGIGNPFRGPARGPSRERPFSITLVLKNMGYVAPWAGTDYQERYPEEYRKARKGLWELARQGALGIEQAEGKDKEQERTLYRVVKEGKLREIAEKH